MGKCVHSGCCAAYHGHLHSLGFARGTELTGQIYADTHIQRESEETERFIFKNWFMQLWGLTSLKSAGLAAA